MRHAVLILLAAVVAVSGCTDDLVTESDMDQQTEELKQHTSQAVESDNDLVWKFRIQEIDFDGTCVNESVSEKNQSFEDLKGIDPSIYNRASGIQEFQEGSYIVRNGLDLTYVNEPYCGAEYDLHSLVLFDVSYNKTVYQDGSVISTASERCSGLEHVSVDDSYSVDVEKWILQQGKRIYTECLDIPVDSWEPITGGDAS